MAPRVTQAREPQFVLASASPRRRELLLQLGYRFVVMPVDVDESPGCAESPGDYVQRLAGAKALAAKERWTGRGALGFLGADTAVAIGDRILGKPRDRAHGMAMLSRLSGRVHTVWSAVAFCADAGIDLELQKSRVTFRKIEEHERAVYWASGEPDEKAGGYGIQGLAAAFVSHLEGSYSGVMGLPLFETAQLLARNQIKASPVLGEVP